MGWGEKGGWDFQGGQPKDGKITEVKGRMNVGVFCEQPMDEDKGVVLGRALVTSLRGAGEMKDAAFREGG